MKRKIFFPLFCLLSLSVFAQTDPVLMRINGKDITRSEFEYIYNKNNSLNSIESKSLNDYVDLFVNFKLKVFAAEEAGIDTTRSFREELEGYRRQLSKSYLVDEKAESDAALAYYEQMKRGKRPGRVQVMHIFKYLPQNVDKKKTERVQQQMDSISNAIIANPSIDFDELVKQFSDDKNKFWVSFLQTPEEFEDVVFNLNKGEISRPFFSPQGMHIVKVLDRMELPPFDEVKDEISVRLTRRTGTNKGVEAVVDRLKKEYNYQENEDGIKELMLKGETQKKLFSLAGKDYTGAEFKQFAATYPRAIKTQLSAFTSKSILSYENSRLEQKYPAFRLLMQEYKEGMLLFEISNREVWNKAATDEKGLEAYYNTHRSLYNWSQPKYKGIVVHCADKSVANKIKKLIRKVPQEMWADSISHVFNKDNVVHVKIDTGLFSLNDNTYVDYFVFKKGDYKPMTNYPYTTVFGTKLRGPESYKDVRGPLAADYQNFLDDLWVKKLRSKSKVEINQQVLKTVNNHGNQ